MKISTLSRNMALLLALTLVPACGDKKEEEAKKAEVKPKAEKPKAPKAPKKKVKVANLSPSAPRTRMGEIPVAADLEVEAERTVAVENLEAELDRLETEIVSIAK